VNLGNSAHPGMTYISIVVQCSGKHTVVISVFEDSEENGSGVDVVPSTSVLSLIPLVNSEDDESGESSE